MVPPYGRPSRSRQRQRNKPLRLAASTYGKHDVLLTVEQVCDRGGVDLPWQVHPPQLLAGLLVVCPDPVRLLPLSDEQKGLGQKWSNELLEAAEPW